MGWLLRGLCFVFVVSSAVSEKRTSLKEAKEYLAYLDKEECEYQHRIQITAFNYYTNVTEENNKEREKALYSDNGIKNIDFDWESFNDPDVYRQAKLYGYLTPEEVYDISDDTYQELDNVQSEMVSLLSTQTVCNYTNRNQCDIPIDPVIKNIFYTSNDPDELKYYWLAHQNKVSSDIKPLFSKYVALGRKYAQYFNYSNKADQWLDILESPPVNEFEQVILNLYEQFKPFYLQLHAFVRKQLYKYYGPCVVDRKGPIPIHLSGAINAEIFTRIVDKIKPYPNKDSGDVTPEIVKQHYTVKKLEAICDDFYQSLGLPPMPDTFWKNSLFEKPPDRNCTCFGSAWDMYDKKDYRMLICAEPNMEDLLGLCHETGHIQYAIGYKDQVCCYRTASAVVNEAFADVAGLSIITTNRLGKLGLLKNAGKIDHEVEINQLFFTALDKISFLPYAMIVDVWRWRYFRGEITDDNANKAWWDLRLQYQGIAPPEPRPDDGLDQASKSHVVDDTPYIQYFMSDIIQFQMQEALCKVAGKYDPSDPASPPLNKCDLYGSHEAGKLLKNMFSLGDAKPWPYALKEVTGDGSIDARPVLKYFAVLHEWLKADNERTGEVIGW